MCVIFSGIRCDELIEEFDIMNHLNYVKDSLNQMTRQGLASIYPVTFFIQNNTIAFSKQQNSYFYSREWDIENYFKEPAQSVCVIFSGIRCDELIEEFDIMNHLNYVKDSLNQMTRQGLASIYPVTFFIQNNTIAFSKQQNSYFYSREWDIENYFKEIFRVQ